MHQWARRQGRMGDDPPFLTVGTEVSAKYKGAFCEAKVRKVVRSVKCKVTFKLGLGTISITDDQIRGGTLRVGSVCEVKHPEKKEFVEAIINKIQDCSQYTVVFDDGDITTLRRTALCLKSGRHFAESETLDQLPLTHPEHFGNPVIGGRKGRRSRQAQEDSSDEEDPPKKGKKKEEKEADIGKVVCVELGDKKKQKDNWFPGLVVAPTAQDTVRIRVKDEYLVRSFKDGRYFTVPKKEATEFTREIGNKVDNHTLKAAVEKALQYLDRDELPPHWDRDLLFGLDESSGNSDSDGALDSDSSDDEPREEKDHFVAQLYKFMDDRGTPINRGPTIGSKDVDLYKLFKVVHKLGGYNRVTNHNQWKTISQKLGFGQGNSSITNLVKQSYKKFLHSFEDFYRKLGCTMVNHPRGHRSRHRTGRSLIRDRDRATPTNIAKEKEKKEEKATPSLEKPSTSETAEKEAAVPEKKEEEKSEKKEEEKKEEVKPRESTKKSKAREDKTDATSKQKGKDAADSTNTEAEEKDNRSRNKKDSKATEPKVPRLFEDLEKEETDTAPEELPEQEPSEETKPRELKSKGRESKPKERTKTSSEKSKSKEDKVKILEEEKSEDSKKKVEKKPAIEEEEKLTRAKTKEDSKSRKEAGVSRESPRETRTPVRDSSNRTPVRLRKEEDAAAATATAAAAAAATAVASTAMAVPAAGAAAAATAAAATAAATAAAATATTAAAAANLKKRGRKRKETDEKAKAEESMGHLASHVTVCVGDKLKVYYGPTHESKVTYEAKVLDIEEDGSECMYLVHYTGWNTRYDEWIKRGRIADNLSWTPSRAKRQRQQQSQHKTSRPSLGKRGRPSTSGRGQDGMPNPPRSTTPSSVTSSSSRTKSPATRTTPRAGRSAGDGASPGREFRRRTRRMSGHTDVSVASDTESEEFESEAEPESEMAQTRSRTTEQRRSASASANTSASSATPHSAPDKEEQSPITSTPIPKEEPVRRPAQTRKKASGGGKKKDSSSAAAVTAARISIPADDEEEKPVLEAVVTEQLQQSAEKRRSRRGKRSPAASSHSPPQRPKLTPELKTDTKTETSAGTESEEDIAQPKGRDFDLNQIRSELKGIEKAVKSPLDLTPPPPPPGDVADDEDEDDEDLKIAVKQEPEEKAEVKQESKINTKTISVVPALFADIEDEELKVKPKELMRDVPVSVNMSTGATTSLMEEEEDIYEFKEPEPFEFEVRKRESPDSKGLARRPAVTATTRKLELPVSAPELPPPALSANVSVLTSVTSLTPTRSADTKSPRKRQIRTPPKDATPLEGGKKIRRAPQKKIVSELTKNIAELKEETSASSPPQVQLSLHERVALPSYVPASSPHKNTSIEQAYEKLCTTGASPPTSTSLTLGVKPNLGVRTLGVTSPIPILNIDENPVSPPILSLPDDDDDDDDDDDPARKSPELGPLRSIFSEAHDDGDDDDHEDRLVISESDDMVEPLFTYQQRDHEDIFPTLVTSTAVVTAAVCTDTGKAEDPPCLSPATHSTGIFRGFSSPVREPADIAMGVNVGSTLMVSRGRSPLHQQQQKLQLQQQQQSMQQQHLLLQQPSKHPEQPQPLKFQQEQSQLPKLQQESTHLPKQQVRHLFSKHQQDYPHLSKQHQEQPHLPKYQPELPQLPKQQCELPLLSKQQEQPQLPKQQQEQPQLLKQQQELPQLSKLQQERSQSPKHHDDQPQLKQLQEPPQLMKQPQEPPQLLKQQQEPMQFLKQHQEVPQFPRQKQETQQFMRQQQEPMQFMRQQQEPMQFLRLQQEPPQILRLHEEQPQLLKQQQERHLLEQQHEQPQMLKQQEQLQFSKQQEEQLRLPKQQEEQLQLPKQQEEHVQLPKEQEEQLQLSKEQEEQLQLPKEQEELLQLPKEQEEQLQLPKEQEEQLQLPKQLEKQLQMPKQLQMSKQLEKQLQLPKQLEEQLQLPKQLEEQLQLPKQLEEHLQLPKQQQEQLQLSKQLLLLRQQQEKTHLPKQQQEQTQLMKRQQQQLQLPKKHQEQLQSLKLQEQPPLLPNPLHEQLQLPKQHQEQVQAPKKQQEQLLLSKQRHQEHPEFPKQQQEQYSKHPELLQLSKQQLEQPQLPKQQLEETQQLKQPPTHRLTHHNRLPQQQRSQDVQQPAPAIQRVLGSSPARSHSSRTDSPAEIRHGEDVIKELLKQQDDEYEDDSINAAIRRVLDHSIMEEEEEDTTGDTELFCGKQMLASDVNDPTSSGATVPASISSQKGSPTSSTSPRHSSGGTTPARKRVARVVLSSTFLDSEDSMADSSDDEGQRLIIDPMDDEGSSQPRSCSSPLSATELRLHITEADSEHRPSGTEDDADLEASVDLVDDELRTEDEETLEETSIVMSRVPPTPAPDDSSSASELVTAAPIVTEEETMEAEDLPSATPEEEQEDHLEDDLLEEPSGNRLHINADGAAEVPNRCETVAPVMTPVIVKVDLDDSNKMAEAEIISGGVVVLDASSSELSSAQTDDQSLRAVCHTTTTTVVTATIVASSPSSLNPQSPTSNIVCEASTPSDASPILALAAVPLGEAEAAEIRQEPRSDDADSQLLGSLLCQETIPGSPAQAGEGCSEEPLPESKVLVLEMPFASVPASSCDATGPTVSLPVPMSVPLSIPVVTPATTAPAATATAVITSEELPTVAVTTTSVPPDIEDLTAAATAGPAQHHLAIASPGVSKLGSSEAAPVMENTPPTTPDSTLSTMSGSPREEHGDMSPTMDNESSKSHRDSFEMDIDSCPEGTKVGHFSEDDSLLNVEVSNSCDSRLQGLKLIPKKSGLDLDKDNETSPKKRRRSHKRSESESNKRVRCSTSRSARPTGGTGSDSDDTSENSALGCTPMASSESTLSSKSPRPSKYNFYVELDPELDGSQRIALLQQKLQELRKTYMNVKAELACIDRRRKKLRRREREVEKATKQEVACS